MEKVSIDNSKYGRLAVGVVMMTLLGVVYAWSIFRAPLTAIFPDWSLTQISLTFSLSMIFFCLGIFVAGKLCQYMPHRHLFKVSAGLVLIGLVMLYFILDPGNSAKSLISLYVLYGGVASFGVGLSFSSVLASVSPWFPGKEGTCSGILLMGFGCGGLLLGSVVSTLYTHYSIGLTFAVIGCGMAIVLFTGSFFMKRPPRKRLQEADPYYDLPGDSIADAASEQRQYTLKEAVRTPSFWLFFAWLTLLTTGGMAVINSAANMAVYYGLPAIAGLVISVFNGIGRPVIGTANDLLGRRRSMTGGVIILFTSGVALLLGAQFKLVPLIMIGLALLGICFGGASSTSCATMPRFFGMKNYPAIYGAVTFSLVPSAILGPILSSKLQELSGGAYLSTFIMILIVAVLTFIVSLLVDYFCRRDGLESEALHEPQQIKAQPRAHKRFPAVSG
jgi:OFA family oxalate/formate antiporter-like MFS transporter